MLAPVLSIWLSIVGVPLGRNTNRVSHWIRKVDSDHPSGIADDNGPGRNVLCHGGQRTNTSVIRQLYRTQDDTVRTEVHRIAQAWIAPFGTVSVDNITDRRAVAKVAVSAHPDPGIDDN